MKASLQILFAANNLGDTFTEWDLSVRAWNLYPDRFGMPGHAEHPDHKRVYAELVASRKSSAVGSGFLDRVRPNVFRLTPKGKAVVAATNDTAGVRLANALLPMRCHYAFAAWQRDPSLPKTRKALGLFDLDGAELVGEAVAWMARAGVEYLYRPAPDVFIHASTVAELGDFITAMRARFTAGKQLAGAV